ncbi:MAG TPA: VWA domain-containing protein [Pyrinomonadaceae bacterium]|jgi:VWFA-related protein|nr:VWA domain-containing protein [Pyrinomonadaceae bacterium]
MSSQNFLSRGLRHGLSFALSLLLVCGGAGVAVAQEAVAATTVQDEVVKVRTRVVFLDALVTDKKTKSFASGLAPENFEVLADGQPRPVSYFTREGDKTRRPLALAIVFDLERLGAGRYMRRTEILEAMAAELSKLPPEDEVAVIVLDPNGVEDRREWLTPFTRNRAQVASAMAIVPTLVGEGAGGDGGSDEGAPAQEAAERRAQQAGTNDATQVTVERTAESIEGAGKEIEQTAKEQEKAKQREKERAKEREKGMSISIGTGSGVKVETPHDPKDEVVDEQDEDVEIDYIKDKKGNTVKRIVKPDGAMIIERTNKDGTTTQDYQEPFDLAAAAVEITKRIAAERPNSQPAIVYITDGIAPVFYTQRDYVEAKLLKSNVIFSALVTDMKTGFKFAMPILKPLGNLAGISISGSAQHLAKATGGESVRVRRPADYANGLSLIVGNLNARYSLGFTLAETETDDGRMHPLEVRVRAKDAKGKERKLEVKARRGYYLTTDTVAKKSSEAAKKNEGDDKSQSERVKN